MDGIHDMGGMHGFGKVEPEPNEPVFHAPWEGRTLALNRALGYAGIWTIDQTRYGIERLPPDVYLSSSYYRKWEIRLENLMVELGLIGADELKAGHALRPGKALKRTLTAAEVPNTLSRVTSAASFSSLQPSVPAGRIGSTMKRVSAVESQTLMFVPVGKVTPKSASTPRGSFTARERYGADLYQTGGRPSTSHG